MTSSSQAPGPPEKRPKRIIKREQFEGWVLPRMVRHPQTGEWVRPFGPRQLIVKPRRGRPALPAKKAISRLIEAEIAKRKMDPAARYPKSELAARLATEHVAKSKSRHVQKIARWLRTPTRGPEPWS